MNLEPKTPNDIEALNRLATRLTARGTRPSRGEVRKLHGEKSWFVPEAYMHDWRHVAFRWLRRFVGGEWHVGGHHVGRLNYGPAIGDRRRERSEIVDTSLRVDGRLAVLEVIR